MESQQQFELPKSPALTIKEETEENDVEYVGSFSHLQPTWHPNITGAHMSRFLATPPQSPNGFFYQPNTPDMPTLTAMLSTNPSTGFMTSIPCFLCQQPFYDIDSLREHLTNHATQLTMRIVSGSEPLPAAAPVDVPVPTTQFYPQASVRVGGLNIGYNSTSMLVPAPPPLPALTSPSFLEFYPSQLGRDNENTDGQFRAPVSVPVAPHFQCAKCKKVLISESQLNAHLTLHHKPQNRNEKKIKCPQCKRSYKRHANLIKHMQIKHNEESSRTPTPPERMVWNTKLLNAVAAANYSPAKEPSSKYLAPSEGVQEEFNSYVIPPKQKYPPRSPFFNPNLWLDSDAYLQ